MADADGPPPKLTEEQKRENAKTEYAAIGQLIGPTSLIRFATLAAFFAVNSALLAAVLRNGDSLNPLAVIGLVGNVFLLLIEYRTINAHRTITKRGAALEKVLLISNGIFSRQANRSFFPLGHGRILKAAYILAAIVWLAIFAYQLGKQQIRMP